MHNDCLKSEDLKYFEMIMEKEHLSISYKIILVNMQENYDYCEIEKIKKDNLTFWGMEIFFKLFLTDIIKNGSVLYLDTDVLCLGNIDFMYNFDLESNVFIKCNAKKYPDVKNINAGVMSINIDRARKLNFKEKSISYIKNNIKHTEEMLINDIFFEYTELPRNKIYNIQSHYINHKKLNDIALIHFVSVKPWCRTVFFRKSIFLANLFYNYCEMFILKENLLKFKLLRINNVYITRFIYSIVKFVKLPKLAKNILKLNEKNLMQLIDVK